MNRSMVTTEEFLRYFGNCLPLEFLSRGFTVSSYQRLKEKSKTTTAPQLVMEF